MIFLCVGDSYDSCKINLEKTIKLLIKLGFIINYKKSVMTPSRRCKYLGFILDSEKYSIDLTSSKKNQICKLLDGVKKDKVYKIREFAHILGVLIAACPGVEYSKIYS